MHKKSFGFTLIELLVVIALIGILTAIILPALQSAQKKGRVAQRVSDIKSVQAALEFYYAANHSYPSTGGVFKGACPTFGNYAANDVIPGLAPMYIPAVPTDPENGIMPYSCYVYVSDGTNYMFIDNDIPEMLPSQSAPNYLTYPSLIDPARDGGSDSCIVDGNQPYAWKVSSSGWVCN